MRRLRSVIVLLVAVLALASDAVAGRDYRLREESTLRQTLRFAGSGQRRVIIRNINGEIHVTGSSDPDVQLSMRRVVYADFDSDLKRGASEMRVETQDGGLEVQAVVVDPNGPSCGDSGDYSFRGRRPYVVHFDFTVTVPRDTQLVLCTINHGDVTVQGTRGDFSVSNVNGSIELRDVHGSGTATTVNGPIEATLLEVPRSNSLFKTVNGGIQVTWPPQLAATLRMKTWHGDLLTDFDVVPLTREPAEAPSRRDGRFVYHSNDFASVRVGAGGPEITLETLNGDVHVLKARR
jgi:hypothetical protein